MRVEPDYFTLEEMRSILSDKLKHEHFRIFVFCSLLWQTGVRVSEALSLEIKDIDLAKGYIKVKTLKRHDHFRSIPIHVGGHLVKQLATWIKQEGLKENDRLFKFNRQSAHNYVRKACELAGIFDKRCHAHAIRHSFAMNCAMHAVPLRDLCFLLGHRDITKTLSYYDRIQSGDIKKALGKVPF